MLMLIERMIDAGHRYARYRRTEAELAKLSVHGRLDIDVYDPRETARKAVWG